MALRYNLRKDELTILVDVISMIKSLASVLMAAEHEVAPFIRMHIHHATQQLVQTDMLKALHRAHKRSRDILGEFWFLCLCCGKCVCMCMLYMCWASWVVAACGLVGCGG